MTRKPKHALLFFIVASAVIYLIFRYVLSEQLTVRELEIVSPELSDSHTLVLLSDLHATRYGAHQEELIAAVDAISPDAVLLTGDLAHEQREFDAVAELLDALTARYPCYAVTGNHDRYLPYTNDVRELFREHGAVVLSGADGYTNSAEFGEIRLFGIDDPLYFTKEAPFEEALRSLASSDDGKSFSVLLSHRPEFAETYAKLGFDLTLCGHAHGGQARIPGLLNGLYAPGQGWFPKYAGGSYDLGGRTFLVSRGLMKDDLPRVFNPPEIWVIRLRGEN